jgi:protein transport protein SEC61 subunit alpha
MDLGIGPIISAGWILQFVQAMGLAKANSKKDEKNFDQIEKIFCLIFCFGEAAGQLWYGAYGSPSTLGYGRMAIIIAQLMGAGVIVMMLDEMLKKGYGLGSGISLFIVANTSEQIFWKVFSPVTLSS